MRVDEELGTYLRVLWRYNWLIAACAVLASIVALGVSLLLVPTYSATATLRVASAPGGVADYTYMTALLRLRNTYVEIATSDSSLDKVAEELALGQQPNVEVEVVPETELITISASDPDPARARDIANTLANMMVDQSVQLYGGSVPTAREILERQLAQAKADLDEATAAYDAALRGSMTSSDSPVSEVLPTNAQLATLERLLRIRQEMYGDLLQQYEDTRINELTKANAITIFEPASLAKRPTAPRVPLNAALGLVAGLATGVILAFLFEGMDDSVRGIEDVRAVTTLPIVGQIPERKPTLASVVKLTRRSDGRDLPLPGFHQTVARLLLAESISEPASILVTSAEPGAGKSVAAASLAVCLVEAGHRVVLVDMDFRRPRQHTILDLPNEEGLSDYLRGQIELDATLQYAIYPACQVVTAGSSLDEVPAWLAEDQIGEVLQRLGKDADFVVIDSPAWLSVADPALIASLVDTVILVVAQRQTSPRDLRFTLEQISEVNATIAGIIMNRVPFSGAYRYYSARAAQRPKHASGAEPEEHADTSSEKLRQGELRPQVEDA